ncbi:FAD-dependent thymidylate synthase [Streptomyces antarcticus]|uniref:FAD-dependent thymidylate synthase n=1 Tax=Streptomyces antarcticus TaxID=2996458 RepID=UPI00226E9766|nr:FAD-dependent thymidylate synthase [Streptomyces sp. H34-AA3]MCY0946797.1 FAD-dependent thymidylate synthase [Streptomyces sp. H34-AA3]
MTVQLVDHNLSDQAVVRAARVSTVGQTHQSPDEAADRETGLINYLMRERHGSPFEHGSLTLYVEAPIFVFREWQRHRIASYNEESARYRELRPAFYLPTVGRNLVQVGKPGSYRFEPGTAEQFSTVDTELVTAYETAYRSYERMLSAGIAREVARAALPVGIYSSMYVTMNPRGLMNFLSLRTHREDAAFVSHPQREIEVCADKAEAIFASLMPATHAAFEANGRVAP